MPLELRPVDITDFDKMDRLDDDMKDDSLVSPVVRGIWPPSSERNRWSVQQQRQLFLTDQTARFVKIVDTDRGDELVSLARWHFYEDGYPKSSQALEDWAGSSTTKTSYPESLDGSALEALVVPILIERQNWLPSRAMWFLATLATRASQRCRGAGGMLLKWGTDQAQKEQLPAYLEATTVGKSLYEKSGFSQTGEIRVDLTKFGFSEPMVFAKMAWSPKPV